MGRRKRGWHAAAGLSLGDLRRLCEQKEAELAGAAERREELLAELAGIDSQIADAGGGGSGGGGKTRGRRPGRRGRGPGRPPKAKGTAKRKGAARRGRKARGGARGPRGEGGLQNMIRASLAKSGEPMKLADLSQAVLDAGYATSSSRFAVIVGQRLSEMKDVKKAGRGLYVLRK